MSGLRWCMVLGVECCGNADERAYGQLIDHGRVVRR